MPEQTKYEIELGTLARYQLPRAEAEAEGRKQDLILAQATVRQREDQLKLEITRREDAAVEAAHIVCLDAIEIPPEDNLSVMRDLVAGALAKRPDVAAAKIADENAEINAIGTANGLLPVVIAYADTYNKGASGRRWPEATPIVTSAADMPTLWARSSGATFPTNMRAYHLADFPCTTAGRKPITESSSCNCRLRSSPASATSITSAWRSRIRRSR